MGMIENLGWVTRAFRNRWFWKLSEGVCPCPPPRRAPRAPPAAPRAAPAAPRAAPAAGFAAAAGPQSTEHPQRGPLRRREIQQGPAPVCRNDQTFTGELTQLRRNAAAKRWDEQTRRSAAQRRQKVSRKPACTRICRPRVRRHARVSRVAPIHIPFHKSWSSMKIAILARSIMGPNGTPSTRDTAGGNNMERASESATRRQKRYHTRPDTEEASARALGPVTRARRSKSDYRSMIIAGTARRIARGFLSFRLRLRRRRRRDDTIRVARRRWRRTPRDRRGLPCPPRPSQRQRALQQPHRHRGGGGGKRSGGERSEARGKRKKAGPGSSGPQSPVCAVTGIGGRSACLPGSGCHVAEVFGVVGVGGVGGVGAAVPQKVNACLRARPLVATTQSCGHSAIFCCC